MKIPTIKKGNFVIFNSQVLLVFLILTAIDVGSVYFTEDNFDFLGIPFGVLLLNYLLTSLLVNFLFKLEFKRKAKKTD